jgi:hypothetical protein
MLVKWDSYLCINCRSEVLGPIIVLVDGETSTLCVKPSVARPAAEETIMGWRACFICVGAFLTVHVTVTVPKVVVGSSLILHARGWDSSARQKL